MQLRVNRKPYIYQHSCSPDEEGRRLSRAEMQRFVTECLLKSFEITGRDYIVHTPDFNSGADFSFTKLGRTVCGIVKYIESQDEAKGIFEELYTDKFIQKYPELESGYTNHGTISMFYLAEAKCLDTDDNTPIAGGRYNITFASFQRQHETIATKGENISEFAMYKGYAKSWESGDTDFISDYVCPLFRGHSELAFDEITSKRMLIEHIKHQHEIWDTRKASVQALLVRDAENGDKGILVKLNDNPVGFIKLDFNHYRIHRSNTFVPPKNYEPWERDYELYGTHGDHHAPFVKDDQLHQFVREMLNKSELCQAFNATMNFDGDVATTRVASLKFSEGEPYEELNYMALVAYNPKGDSNEFVSCYPYLDGDSKMVEIVDVLEWDNMLEATIKCRYYSDEDTYFDFHFFATDYYINKSKYVRGAKIKIAFAASAGNVQKATAGFSFEGQKALDFLAKIGQDPTFDEDGIVKPINFSTRELVAFLPNDEKAPDMAEFQSPFKELEYMEFYGNEVNRCVIKLNNDTGLEIPLYFNGDIELEEGDPIMGVLWLTGRLSDPCFTQKAKSPGEMKESFFLMSQVADNFITELRKLKPRSVVDITPAFAKLTALHLPEGHSLFAVKVGNTNHFSYQLFVANFSELIAVQKYIDPEGFMSISDALKYLPDYMVQIKGTSKYAAWQLFVLTLADRYLPYKSAYGDFAYILTNEDTEKASKATRGKYSSSNLSPKFSNLHQNTGYFTVFAWSNGNLVREVYTYVVTDEKTHFSPDGFYEMDNIHDYDNSQNHILFRDGD